MKRAIKRGSIVIVGLLLQILLSLSIYLFFIEHIFVIHLFFGALVYYLYLI